MKRKKTTLDMLVRIGNLTLLYRELNSMLPTLPEGYKPLLQDVMDTILVELTLLDALVKLRQS